MLYDWVYWYCVSFPRLRISLHRCGYGILTIFGWFWRDFMLLIDCCVWVSGNSLILSFVSCIIIPVYWCLCRLNRNRNWCLDGDGTTTHWHAQHELTTYLCLRNTLHIWWSVSLLYQQHARRHCFHFLFDSFSCCVGCHSRLIIESSKLLKHYCLSDGFVRFATNSPVDRSHTVTLGLNCP